MPSVTFVHGMCNKPAADRLLELWLRALAQDDGLNLAAKGVPCRMVYWADVLYAVPDQDRSGHESTDESVRAGAGPDPVWRESLPPDERRWLEDLERQTNRGPSAGPPPQDPETGRDTQERVPLPWAVKRPLMEWWLRDVHHYLFNVEHSPRPGTTYRVQDEIRRRTISAIQQARAEPGPLVVVSHSMGTVIAYDCLKRVEACPEIDALVTVGSPLGLDEIQDKLKPGWTQRHGFPGAVKGRWVNVFDQLDPVAGFDARLADDYQKDGVGAVEDVHEPNSGAWRHDISKYLGGARLREKLRALLAL
jgi:hypothetical protein